MKNPVVKKSGLVFGVVFALSLFSFAGAASAWDGFDYRTGHHVEIEKEVLVRPGLDIEVYEYGEGYKTVEVESIRRSGSSVEVEVWDRDEGEYRTFDMDD